MPKLILARHGQSESNKRGIWAGLTNPDLSPQGRMEATVAGQFLINQRIDTAYVSELMRSHNTLLGIVSARGIDKIPVITSAALNEKDYGIFTGKNKWQVKDEVGEEMFRLIRRSWKHRIKDGESLQDVHARIVPFHTQEILPRLLGGENILIVSHNNTLRAYIKELEGIPEEVVANFELGTAEVRIYNYDVGKFILEQAYKVGDSH